MDALYVFAALFTVGVVRRWSWRTGPPVREKKVREKRCEWCGAKIVRTACPRGPFCATEQRNHEELMARINKKGK